MISHDGVNTYACETLGQSETSSNDLKGPHGWKEKGYSETGNRKVAYSLDILRAGSTGFKLLM